MKKLSVVLLLSILALSGCLGQDADDTVVAPTTPAAVETQPAPSTTDNSVQKVEVPAPDNAVQKVEVETEVK